VKEVDRLKEYLARAGFELELTIGYDRPGTQVFVARDERRQTVVIAFRGTEADDLTDISDDAKFGKIPWANDKGEFLGEVHAGFAKALDRDAVTEPISRYVRSLGVNYRIILTGHSLGAALATLMTTRTSASCLYTFGSCRVGNKTFVQSLRTKNFRFANCCDLVTRVPPEGFDYEHAGLLRYIDSKGRVIETPSKAKLRMDRWKGKTAYLLEYAFRKGTMFTRDLADHAPINYVSAVMGVRMG
jgi:hypothetical protein